MLTLKEEQLNMVSGGAVAMQSETADSKGVCADDIVVWKGHENLKTGVCWVNVFGKCLVEFDDDSFLGFTMKWINENELKVVGHMPPWPAPFFS